MKIPDAKKESTKEKLFLIATGVVAFGVTWSSAPDLDRT
jgi:hypothetical protein